MEIVQANKSIHVATADFIPIGLEGLPCFSGRIGMVICVRLQMKVHESQGGPQPRGYSDRRPGGFE